MKKKNLKKTSGKNEKKSSTIKITMPTRYQFFNIFGINPNTQDIYPLYNMIVNGQYFPQNYSIPRGNAFGGIDIYNFIARDFGGTWNSQTRILTLTTVY